MPPATGFSPASLSEEVAVYSMPWLSHSAGSFAFTYRSGEATVAVENWTDSGEHLVPVTDGCWIMSPGSPAQVRHLFVGHSAAELLCFCQLYPGWLRQPGNAAFVALGLLPLSHQVTGIAAMFPSARFHLVFDNGLTGRVADCQVALWLRRKMARFIYASGQIDVHYGGRHISFPAATFSLHRFEQVTGLRSGIRTHKPRGGHNTFLEYINVNY